ncbi:sugar kinase [Martelella radicis]|uniref:2-dehydro-3-deoxygluconokinase n=1 Tax=Martelella radicis TaxID=1397476 RepID=A0A7W6KGY0_9HYPH|nr:sugar kinase [Martelella radicis]MBB4120883.1 2-dehydro-3-deoxygluconokinase [Martelella radicis]
MKNLPKNILCVGECMVEMAPREDGAYTRGFAGDTFNSAWYLARTLPDDFTVDYFTGAGTDTVSDEMLTFMEKAGVGTSSVRRIDERTVGLYMIALKNGERSFSYWRGQSAAKLLAEDPDVLSAALKGRGLVLFSGITMAVVNEEHRQTLFDLLAEARAAGTVIAFDPNMRARLWPSREVMAETIMKAAAVSDIVLPSFDEDGAVFGDENPEATIARYRAAGVKTVIVKNGPDTIHAEDETDGPVTFKPTPSENVVDTTAAGDSFNAGLIAALMTGAPLVEALEQGSALSARVIGARGALVAV